MIFAVSIGVPMAAFISLSMMFVMPFSLRLALNNLLVIVSLLLAFLIGYRLRRRGTPVRKIALHITSYYAVVMLFYVGSYAVMTYIFSDQLAWIPFFHRDYTYHGFRSVREYMDHANNFRDLLILQIFSCGVCSVLYFAAGFLGSFAGTLGPRPNPA